MVNFVSTAKLMEWKSTDQPWSARVVLQISALSSMINLCSSSWESPAFSYPLSVWSAARIDNRVSPNQREGNIELYHSTNTCLKNVRFINLHQPPSTFIKFIIFPIFPLDRISFTCLLWRQDRQFQVPLKSLPFGSWWPHKWQAKACGWAKVNRQMVRICVSILCIYIYSFLRNCFVRVYYTKNIYMLWAVLWRHMVHNFSNSWYTESTVVNYVKSSEIMDINLYVSYFVMVSWLRLPSSEELNFSLRGVWHHYTTSNARMLVSCNHEKHIFAIRTMVKTAFRVWLSKG